MSILWFRQAIHRHPSYTWHSTLYRWNEIDIRTHLWSVQVLKHSGYGSYMWMAERVQYMDGYCAWQPTHTLNSRSTRRIKIGQARWYGVPFSFTHLYTMSSIEDNELPKANISRVLKHAVSSRSKDQHIAPVLIPFSLSESASSWYSTAERSKNSCQQVCYSIHQLLELSVIYALIIHAITVILKSLVIVPTTQLGVPITKPSVHPMYSRPWKY